MIWFIVAAVLAALDLGIKKWIKENREVNQDSKLFGGKIIVTRFKNAGAFMGLLKNKSKKLLGITVFSCGILAGILMAVSGRKGNFFLKLGLTLMLGGALSNAYDRLNDGEVTDYFSFNFGKCKRLSKIVFNLGDWFIFIGALLAVINK